MRESNPRLLGEKQLCYLCAMQHKIIMEMNSRMSHEDKKGDGRPVAVDGNADGCDDPTGLASHTTHCVLQRCGGSGVVGVGAVS